MLSAQELAQQIDDKARGGGTHWMARCPAHEDNTPSLSITDAHGRPNPLVHCFAGCEFKSIVSHLKERGLWIEEQETALHRAMRHRHDREQERVSVRLRQAVAEQDEASIRDYLNGEGDFKIKPADASPIATMAEFMDIPFPVEQPMLGAINRGTINIFGGLSGVGKSLFAHDVAAALSTGSSLGHWRCVQPWKTLMIDGEMGGRKLQDRMNAMNRQRGYDILTSSMLQFAGMPRIDLMQRTDHDQWCEWFEPYDAVILDNAYTLFPTSVSLPSTGAEYWQHVELLLFRLKQMGIAVVLLDHLNDTGTRLAGTTAKRWAADLVGILYRDPKGPRPDNPEFELRFGYEVGGKVRDEYQPALHGNSQWSYLGGCFDSVRG